MKKLITLFIFIISYQISAQQLDDTERKLIEAIDRNYHETVKLLEETVNINSGTFNLEGVRAVAKVYEREFAKIGFQTEWITLPDSLRRAGHFVATRKGSKGKKLFFIGHLDTVFEKDMPFYPFEMVDEYTAKGQGANDMKGGNAMIFATLKALYDLGLLEDRTITVYFTGDEENSGKPSWVSRLDFVERAKQHDIALGYETAQGFNIATVARRGASGWTLKTTGRQVHSSGVFKENAGYGAIYEAARILNEFRVQLSDEQYLTFNPGQFIGGSDVSYNAETGKGEALGKTNIVSRETFVTGDLRFLGEPQKEAAREKMRNIVSQSLNRTTAAIEFEDGIPSMPPTEGNLALVDILNQVSLDMGYGEVNAGDPGSRGAGDISYVAEYLDCIDGIGASGSGAHSPAETINMKQYPDLIKRSTLFVYRLLK
ncbi:acetylornithine deacetylase/succinyldiaminopimelate desuccinylase-like deacylase [Belliella baltica DSM 15883]|uniref:Acetylornithine deacetylase/succinyldiaminopimelate desuccinylase-like deacylase n=1 Tax=Belliella baltica (strain DSM 15883 / CIP 108006 / LMG 21964 / BA134) TaxID=866536 RepID=I3Z1I8_BELBD|nr:M20/M25/M40 family metallo-hydrolase [Belliella baltica]AFL83106.1 acetylornithine deacetylase/succinyldiaminopimelate desuccinylase-like deacylase [Belliella baltica DSM 15883]